MCFTKYGLTLSRMTILSFPSGEVIEDVFICEPYPGVHILDYNTHFSGVTHKDLYPTKQQAMNQRPVLKGIVAARERLWEYCDENTVIIGHGLDHDFKCLRILHDNVVDTAILWSPSVGVKERLKTLAEGELGLVIQRDTGIDRKKGHDSVEDCWACSELVKKYLGQMHVEGNGKSRS